MFSKTHAQNCQVQIEFFYSRRERMQLLWWLGSQNYGLSKVGSYAKQTGIKYWKAGLSCEQHSRLLTFIFGTTCLIGNDASLMLSTRLAIWFWYRFMYMIYLDYSNSILWIRDANQPNDCLYDFLKKRKRI